MRPISYLLLVLLLLAATTGCSRARQSTVPGSPPQPREDGGADGYHGTAFPGLVVPEGSLVTGPVSATRSASGELGVVWRGFTPGSASAAIHFTRLSGAGAIQGPPRLVAMSPELERLWIVGTPEGYLVAWVPADNKWSVSFATLTPAGELVATRSPTGYYGGVDLIATSRGVLAAYAHHAGGYAQLHARIFDFSGSAPSSERVIDPAAENQYSPRLAEVGDRFALVWQDQSSKRVRLAWVDQDGVLLRPSSEPLAAPSQQWSPLPARFGADALLILFSADGKQQGCVLSTSGQLLTSPSLTPLPLLTNRLAGMQLGLASTERGAAVAWLTDQPSVLTQIGLVRLALVDGGLLPGTVSEVSGGLLPAFDPAVTASGGGLVVLYRAHAGPTLGLFARVLEK